MQAEKSIVLERPRPHLDPRIANDPELVPLVKNLTLAATELPPHLADDPGLVGMARVWTKTGTPLLVATARDLERLNGMQDEATRVMHKHCSGAYVIARGGFNIIFLLTFADGTDAIARVQIQNPLNVEAMSRFSPDLLRLQFLSEVATLAYLRKHTSIPVPQVYHAELDTNNALGTRYTIVERMVGMNLFQVWYTAGAKEREALVRELAMLEAKILQTRFLKIGCIIDESGGVGPMAPSCTHEFTLRDPHRGPFMSSKALLEAHVRSELARMSEPQTWIAARSHVINANGGTDDLPLWYATQWFSLLLAGILDMKGTELAAVNFTLCHDDFNLGNILATPEGKVTALLDWQGSCILPLWNSSRHGAYFDDIYAFKDEQERQKLMALRDEIVAEQLGGRIWYTSVWLDQLLHIAGDRLVVDHCRADLDETFLNWFRSGITAGQEENLQAFVPLKLFIEIHPKDAESSGHISSIGAHDAQLRGPQY